MKFISQDIARYYYYLKPLIPRRVQIMLRRYVAERKRVLCRNVWPIDPQAGRRPDEWLGWPDGRKFALVLTHDVDTFKGHQNCHNLIRLEEDFGLRSSFNFVADGYKVSPALRHHLTNSGFEVGVHGLVHSRELYNSRETFEKHAVLINSYLKAWKSVGFRSPCMYHNLEWLHDLHIAYDASTFDTDPFEPQPDGVGTIFPFKVTGEGNRNGYIELPYTLPQDFTLFILFRERTIDIWKKKLAWIAENGGMALLNTHPDYMKFNGTPGYEEYPARYYEQFLQHVTEKYAGRYWCPLPHEMADFWVCRNRGKKLGEENAFDGQYVGSVLLPGEIIEQDDQEIALCTASAPAFGTETQTFDKGTP